MNLRAFVFFGACAVTLAVAPVILGLMFVQVAVSPERP